MWLLFNKSETSVLKCWLYPQETNILHSSLRVWDKDYEKTVTVDVVFRIGANLQTLKKLAYQSQTGLIIKEEAQWTSKL